jgi:curved DNA-binding protein CbpA
MTTFKNYYFVLSIENFSDVDVVKKAYRRQAVKFHPDKNSSTTSHEKFIEVNEAYLILIDLDKKALYDEVLRHQIYSVGVSVDEKLEEKRKIVKDWILFERHRLFDNLRGKTDKGLTEAFNFLDHYGMGIVIVFAIIVLIIAMTFN